MSRIDFFELSEALARVRSERVALRPVALADAYPLYRATRHPNFNRFLLWEQPDDEDQVLARVDAIARASAAGRLAAFSAVLVETGEWVALYRFQPHAEWPDAAEVGIWTHDRFWNDRYSLEIMRLCFSAAFSLTSLRSIIGAADTSNAASLRLMIRSGMRRTRMRVTPDESGSRRDSIECRITAEEWASLEPLGFVAWDDVCSQAGPAPEQLEQLRAPGPEEAPAGKRYGTLARHG